MKNKLMPVGLVVLITTAILHNTRAFGEPICDVGSCSGYVWDDSAGGFRCDEGTCTCTLLGSGTTTYDCICSSRPSTCKSGSWVSNGTGKEKQQVKQWDCNKCSDYGYNYRCAAGYYGNGTTCTVCPGGGTSPAGTTTVSGCYIPSGRSFSDGTGSGKYTGNCYY